MWPTCGSLVIVSSTLKRWGPSKREVLCSHLAHVWPHVILCHALRSWEPSRRLDLYMEPAHLWVTTECVPRFKEFGTIQAAGVM